MRARAYLPLPLTWREAGAVACTRQIHAHTHTSGGTKKSSKKVTEKAYDERKKTRRRRRPEW